MKNMDIIILSMLQLLTMTATLISERTAHVTTPEQVRECYMDMPHLFAIFLLCAETIEIYDNLIKARDNLALGEKLRLCKYQDHYKDIHDSVSGSPSHEDIENFKSLLRPLADGLPIYSGFREFAAYRGFDCFHKDKAHWAAFTSTDPAMVAIQRELSFEFYDVSKRITTEELRRDDDEVKFIRGKPGSMTILPGLGRGHNNSIGQTAWHMIRRPEVGENKLSIAAHLNYRVIR